ncbi:peptidase associated/transthyretin-like domain-containing protein [Flavobacterium agrisoli]|uniref:Carboxypeptidase-like regulatory domain-containing protein n=1 Tax=Flavobacterium agrisoli TaxID=2793066 RepID=A0A934UKA3_9FLAO|nr:carboxypeptidase-like regulatory domain-containing protein [Flavobacterium agrisoli]MBK0370353.1 carboxypeptidase-like regulatory domain-containing protein [Flavobacterium agrisoli]
MRYLFCLISFVFLSATKAQNAAVFQINGIVKMNEIPQENIFVINKNSEKGVQTDSEGKFYLSVKFGDVLVFSSIYTKEKELKITEDLNVMNEISIDLFPAINELQEVVVRNYSGLNARALGIISADQKTYTPAERKLKSATDWKGAGGVSFDPVLNLISGRTAMLKKEVEVEKKEFYMLLLDEMFDQHHFVNRLQIPTEYVKGFKYYVVENKYFTRVLDSKNKTATEFLLGELALKYKDILACENE